MNNFYSKHTAQEVEDLLDKVKSSKMFTEDEINQIISEQHDTDKEYGCDEGHQIEINWRSVLEREGKADSPSCKV